MVCMRFGALGQPRTRLLGHAGELKRWAFLHASGGRPRIHLVDDGYVHVRGLLSSVLHAIALLSLLCCNRTSAAHATVRQLVALQTCVVAAVQQALHSLETQVAQLHKMLLRGSLRSMARVRHASTTAAAAPRCVVELISDTM